MPVTSVSDTAKNSANSSKSQKLVPLRFVTAASLFDGHDASINIMRRILQGAGVEVIHLAHNRSVAEVVQTALQEDVQGIAISSYQGGHVEYFKYVVDLLKEACLPVVEDSLDEEKTLLWESRVEDPLLMA